LISFNIQQAAASKKKKKGGGVARVKFPAFFFSG